MKALLFPGQGSQIIGMGQQFFEKYSYVREIFEKADQRLGYKLSKIIFEGPNSDLQLTKNTQPAILTVSYSIFTVLVKEFNFNLKEVKYFAGHSLGEYSALVSSKSLDFEDAIYLLHERGKAMQEAVPVGEGSMIAILGSEIEEINNIVSEIKGKEVCEIANDNAPGQVIVSGETKTINKLQENLKAKKKKSIILPVSAPFHCSLMNQAAIRMKDKINSIVFKSPEFSIVSNVTAKPEKNVENIKKLLIEQIFSKVRWRESVTYMIDNNISEFIEIGPGKVLSGMVKRINKESKPFSINSIDDIKMLT